MKIVAYARNLEELASLRRSGTNEVLLGHRDLSRQGTFDTAELSRMAQAAKAEGICPVLDWDVLMDRPAFEQALATLNELDLGLFEAVRVQDPGAYEYAISHLPKLPIQLVLETGNHNLQAVRRWCEYGGSRVERVSLSIELPAKRVAEYIQALSCAVELLVLGPIPLLYTPRRLLSYQREETDLRQMERAVASGVEEFHAGFRVVENQHGTQVFHAKDYCLLDRVEELGHMNLGAARVDLRLESDSRQLLAAAEVLRGCSNRSGEDFKSSYPNKVTRCFFQANATDVLLKRLKNSEIERRDDGYIGRVVESSKVGNYLVVNVQGRSQTLRQGQRVKLITPNGVEIRHQIDLLNDLERRPLHEASQGQYVVLPHLKSVTAETVIYRED